MARTVGHLVHVHSRVCGGIRTGPYLWAMTNRLVVTVSGDLTRAELLRVAESLE